MEKWRLEHPHDYAASTPHAVTNFRAYLLPGGQIKPVDRIKDVIIVSGFNVYPNEVEDVLAGHPGVLEVAVIGVPDEHAGEAVAAYIVPKDLALTPEAVAAGTIGPHRSSWRQYASIPRSAPPDTKRAPPRKAGLSECHSTGVPTGMEKRRARTRCVPEAGVPDGTIAKLVR